VVPVPASHFFPPNESALFEILDDTLYSTFRDANRDSNLSKHELWVRIEY